MTVLGRRARRSVSDRQAAGEAIARHGLAAWSTARCVAAYHSMGGEPNTHALLDGLRAVGVRVMLPVVTDAADLDWAEYDGRLELGSFGISQPPGPRLGLAAIAEADVVVVAALAVDRQGHRLGRGKGHYDRALRHATDQIVAIVHDDEVLDAVPVEPHDVSVDAILTPTAFRRV